MEIIQRRLSPEEQTRLAYLRQQNETGIIADTEHQELLVYVDRVELQDSDRAEALIKLAQLRQVDLKVLVDDFLPSMLILAIPDGVTVHAENVLKKKERLPQKLQSIE